MNPSPSLSKALAATTIAIIGVIRQYFPVRGRPWSTASADPSAAMQALQEHLPGMGRCVWPLNGAVPPQELIDGLRQIFAPYGWWVYLTGTLDRTGRLNPPPRAWYWPDVPEADPVILDSLEAKARELLGLEPVSDQEVRQGCQVGSPSDGGQTLNGQHELASSSERPAYERDHLFLAWYEDDRLPTYHSPAQIRDKWNALRQQERLNLSRRAANIIGQKQVGLNRVKAAIRAARREATKNPGKFDPV